MMSDATEINFNLTSSTEVLLTSAQGDRLARKDNVQFRQGSAGGENIIRVRPEIIKQTLAGIGGSFTESSAFVLAHLDAE